MTYIIFLITIFCDNPIMYSKFEAPGVNKNLQYVMCVRAIEDCYQISHDVRYCLKRLKDM